MSLKKSSFLIYLFINLFILSFVFNIPRNTKTEQTHLSIEKYLNADSSNYFYISKTRIDLDEKHTNKYPLTKIAILIGKTFITFTQSYFLNFGHFNQFHQSSKLLCSSLPRAPPTRL